jgi:NTE family protein
VVAAAALPAGRIGIDALGDGIRQLYGTRPWPAGALWICAVCLDTGSLTVFGRSGAPSVDIGTAVQASCAIPGYFAPVPVDGVSYVDGGAHSPTNANLLTGLGLDLVVVSSPMSTADAGPRAALRAPTTLQLASEVRAVRRRGTPVLTFQPTAGDLAAMGWNAMDFSRRGAVARHAFASARRRLEHANVQERLEILRQGPATS